MTTLTLDPALHERASLTPDQRRAVEHAGGPLLIVAGAGTGKTTVLTHRIAHLIATKAARPDEILALTFTEKAAAGMEERVDLLVPYGYADVWVSTFHAFADRVLRENALRLGLPTDFRVLTRTEQALLLREHLFELPLARYRPSGDPARFVHALAGLISRAKDEDASPADYAAFAASLRAGAGDEAALARAASETELAELYAAYDALLRERGCVDFGDQIVLLLRLLREHADVRASLVARFPWIVVDEFQDTNHAQFEVLRLLAGGGRHITVVADDDQAIYTFRGAEARNVEAFLDAFPDAARVSLTDNFRSRQDVLDAARRLIVRNNPHRLEVTRGIDKELRARREGSAGVRVHRAASVDEEADWAAAEIARVIAAGVPRRDVAVLVRANDAADPFLRALTMAGVEWRFTGNQGLYAQPAVATLRHLARALVDPEDSQSLYALAGGEPYAVPPLVLGDLAAVASREGRPLLSVMRESAHEDVARVLADLDRLRTRLPVTPTGHIFYAFLQETGWLPRLVRREHAEDETSVQNIARFLDEVRRFSWLARADRMPYFDEHLRAVIAAGDDPAVAEPDREADAVHVLTVHQAKGLEFACVFLVGLAQRRFPAQGRTEPLDLPRELVRAGAAPRDARLEEERRLFYVAMTRARDLLVMTSAADYGTKRPWKQSQFIAEALDRPAPEPARPVRPEAAIARAAPPSRAIAAAIAPSGDRPVLTPSRVDDYLQCPLRYRYAHVLRVPMRAHHAFVYGHAVRASVRTFLQHRVAGGILPAEEVVETFRAAWRSEGFLTRLHEDQRFAEGEAAVRAFHARETTPGARVPSSAGAPYSVVLDGVRLSGTWDRVDTTPSGGVSVGAYTSSSVRDEATARTKARERRGLALAALAWRASTGRAPDAVAFHFVGNGLTGEIPATDALLARAEEDVARAADGIRAGRFTAAPDAETCRRCTFASVCPESAANG